MAKLNYFLGFRVFAFSLFNFLRINLLFLPLSSAGASSPAFPANAGNGDASRRDKSSADSHAVLGSVLLGASVPSCRPWERGDLLRRLSTFKLAGKLHKVGFFMVELCWKTVGIR